MSRVGVFVCHCGQNIAGTVDVTEVVTRLRSQPEVAFTADYKYMCSDPGQQLIRQSIAEHGLDAVVVAACSPAMHETTFRKTVAGAGVNPYRCECANIREQVSWVHQADKPAATQKAIAIAASIVEKVARNEALEPLSLPVTQRCLVIGGGLAGMQAALDVAQAGYPVVLIEREKSLGGKMASLSGTYLNLAGGQRILHERIAAIQAHPGIQVLTSAELVEVTGFVGNFKARVVQADADTSSPTEFTLDVGAIVVATGWDGYDRARLPEYGGEGIPDVIDAFEFERLLASGEAPRRPSDGRIPQQVVFIQCAGSRDPERGVPYCSKVCCMVVAKQAMVYKERVPEGQAYVFYIDIRSAGKGYEEYVQRAMQDHDVLYLRGKVSRVYQDGEHVAVWGADTLSDQAVQVNADLVVLATPMVSSAGAVELGQRLRISADANGFFNEAHPKLRPVETLTAGVMLAGACQGPKDIPETLAQASGAAAKVLQLFSRPEMMQAPTVAAVNRELVRCLRGVRERLPLRRPLDPPGVECGHRQRRPMSGMRRLRGHLSQQGLLRPQLAAGPDPGDGGRDPMTAWFSPDDALFAWLSPEVTPDLAGRVNAASGQEIELCYHCHKCTAGCPVAEEMTFGPDRVLRLVQLGERKRLLESSDIWLCAGCETCATRCPNAIDIARVMDVLRHMALAEAGQTGEPDAVKFHRLFLLRRAGLRSNARSRAAGRLQGVERPFAGRHGQRRSDAGEGQAPRVAEADQRDRSSTPSLQGAGA